MKRVEGNAGVKLLECTNPVRNRWRVRWDVTTDSTGITSYMEEEFDHCPTTDEIRSLVVSWYNGQTAEFILTGFSFEGASVWLSGENQFNYKSAHDLACQTQGASLPVTFKFGTDEEPQYRTFDTLDDLSSFTMAWMEHIRSALADGWRKKDAFDAGDYRV